MISRYSIAILPMVNMSPDRENEYFSDGITEQIINALCRYENLLVTSRTSSFAFKNQNIDIRDIGKKLNVFYLLEGSIRRSGEMVRITAQLVKAEDGFHIWSETWDRELKDIFILQDEIALIIGEQINSKIRQPIKEKESVIENTRALDHYLKGQYLLNNFEHAKRDQIIRHFEQALAIDPNFENAYIGLCNAYTWLSSVGVFDILEANAKTEENIRKLMRLNPNTPEIYMLISGKNFWIDWNLSLALENVNRTIELKPNTADAFVQQGMIYIALGCIDEAFDSLYHAQRLNPYDEVTEYCIGFLHSLINENEKAMELVSKSFNTLSLWDAHFFLSVETLCKLNRFDEAWNIIEEKKNIDCFAYMIPCIKGLFYSIKGNYIQAVSEIDILERGLQNPNQMGMPFYYYLSKIYIYLGEREKAIEYFEKGIQFRATPILFSKIDCSFDPMRDEPRFRNALISLNFEIQDTKPLKPKYKRTVFTRKQIRETEKRLSMLMETEKPFLNPRLSSPDLSEMIDISTNMLSQFLNEHLNKNFYDYLNSYRLKEFQHLCKNPKYAHLSILGLAYECGFNSKTTFNAFFKREMGVTPSEYYKQSV
ncbi:MAG: helix-turn-helix domain-containing protein [Bacteroidales bacterium]